MYFWPSRIFFRAGFLDFFIFFAGHRESHGVGGLEKIACRYGTPDNRKRKKSEHTGVEKFRNDLKYMCALQSNTQNRRDVLRMSALKFTVPVQPPNYSILV